MNFHLHLMILVSLSLMTAGTLHADITIHNNCPKSIADGYRLGPMFNGEGCQTGSDYNLKNGKNILNLAVAGKEKKTCTYTIQPELQTFGNPKKIWNNLTASVCKNLHSGDSITFTHKGTACHCTKN